MCYDSYMQLCVLFTYFTVVIVQDSLEDQPLAEGTLLLKKIIIKTDVYNINCQNLLHAACTLLRTAVCTNTLLDMLSWMWFMEKIAGDILMTFIYLTVPCEVLFS